MSKFADLNTPIMKVKASLDFYKKYTKLENFFTANNLFYKAMDSNTAHF